MGVEKLTKLRLGVALMVPEPLATEVQGLRRACGDHGRMAPHLTLVPPVNVRQDELSDALEVVRRAARNTRPFVLALGPPSTFLPNNPVMFLQVGGDLDALLGLRSEIFVEPLSRSLAWPFTPHVTICDDGEPTRLHSAVAALMDYQVTWSVDRVHLLQEQSGPGHGHHRWVPFLDVAFGDPLVIGRGGFELEIATSECFDAWSRATVASWAPPDGHDAEVSDDAATSTRASSDHTSRSVLRASHQSELVGVLTGHRDGPVAMIDSLVVRPDLRRMGVGRHLAGAFGSAMASVGVTQLSVWVAAGSEGEMLYAALGFTQVHQRQDFVLLVRWMN